MRDLKKSAIRNPKSQIELVARVGIAPTFQVFQACTNLSQLSSHLIFSLKVVWRE
jgi:hypothetical protein